MKAPLAVWRQHYLPQHAISRFAGKISHCRIPWLKNFLIRDFIRRYSVNMADALNADLNSYSAFHDFFIRHLHPSARTVDSDTMSLCSPADGAISQIGKIEAGTVLQAKGRRFSVQALLGSAQDANAFLGGNYATIYLAPKDYHRVHMPAEGILDHVRYIPGKLFSVNPLTAQHVDNLFARNERVVAFFKHPQGGSFALVLVGAMIVGSISTSLRGDVKAYLGKHVVEQSYAQGPNPLLLNKGEEMGFFSLGSTVIVLCDASTQWDPELKENSPLNMGQRIGEFKHYPK